MNWTEVLSALPAIIAAITGLVIAIRANGKVKAVAAAQAAAKKSEGNGTNGA